MNYIIIVLGVIVAIFLGLFLLDRIGGIAGDFLSNLDGDNVGLGVVVVVIICLVAAAIYYFTA